MGYIVRDYRCTKCNEEINDMLVLHSDPPPSCPLCGEETVHCLGAPHRFSTIVPTYPGSKMHKAGYVHQFANRPAEKVSVQVPKKGSV